MEVIALLFVAAVSTIISVMAILAVLPFFKNSLLEDPNHPEKNAIFTNPKSGWSSIIMRESRVEHVIAGKGSKDGGITDDETFSNPLLKMYDKYAFMFGLRLVGIPGIHTVRTYDLPRYRKKEEGGKLIYEAVKEGDPGRRTNHYRTQLTPWFNEFTSVDIEGIPFNVKCATNYSLDKEKIEEVAFMVESWNTLLDQALNSVARGLIRQKISLDDAIGGISQDVFKDGAGEDTKSDKEIQKIILDGLLEYKLRNKGQAHGRTLAEIGIIIEGFEILDFAPEKLTDQELIKLRSPSLERRAGQARVMAGKAEAIYQEEILAVLSKYPELAAVNVNAEAFVRAAKEGTLDALAAALLKNLVK